MKGQEDATENTQRMAIPVEASLRRRLQWNEPVLHKLPEVGGADSFERPSLKIISFCRYSGCWLLQ